MKKKFFSAALAAAMVVTSVFSTTSVAGAAENETAVPYGNVTVKQEGNTVTIGNDAIKRTFSTADKKLSTTEIVNKRTGGEETVFTPQEGSEEFVVKTTKEKKDPITLPGINRTGWEATADSYQNASGDSDGPDSFFIECYIHISIRRNPCRNKSFVYNYIFFHRIGNTCLTIFIHIVTRFLNFF